MKQYILTILGVVLIGCLIDVILPSGKMNNYIKSMFAIFVLATIISPITSMLQNSHIYLNNVNNVVTTNADILYEDMISQKEKYIISMLDSNGYKGVDINLQYCIENDEIKISSSKVFINKLVIDSDKQHINKYDYIRRIIKNCVALDDEEIVFYE